MKIKHILPFIGISLMMVFTTCEWLEEQKAKPEPTRDLMLGVWEISEAIDLETGDTITGKTKVLYSGLHLSSDNTVISTTGPLVTYLVYGDTKWTEISSIIDEVFNYADLSFNGGEFFTSNERTFDRFTFEPKLEGIGGSKSLEDIMDVFNIHAEWMNTVVYHKFIDVKVEINGTNPNHMVWTFDDSTITSYNIKNQHGEPVAWEGYTAPFRKCKWIMEKRSKSLKDLVREAKEN